MADLTETTPRVRYHIEFGRSVSKGVGINREPPKQVVYEVLMCSNNKCIFWVFTWIVSVQKLLSCSLAAAQCMAIGHVFFLWVDGWMGVLPR